MRGFWRLDLLHLKRIKITLCTVALAILFSSLFPLRAAPNNGQNGLPVPFAETCLDGYALSGKIGFRFSQGSDSLCSPGKTGGRRGRI